MNNEHNIKLSKTLSYALRHAPWEFELELDEEGWVDIELVLSTLRKMSTQWQHLSVDDLKHVIETSEKKRHEILDNRIRALYGHSTPQKLLKKTARPPEILYHGTSPKKTAIILKEGLRPMSRHYVHLSVDVATAQQVGKRKAPKPDILIVQAQRAYDDGIKFYLGNEHVWLADYIPADYIMCSDKVSV